MLPDSFAAVPSASGPVFMFCAPRLVFGGTEGVGSRLHVLRSRTRFRRYRGRRVPFSFFALPDSVSAITKGDGSHFYVLCSRTRFRRYRGGPVFYFCAPGLIFGGIEGVGSHFQFLRSQTHFRRYQGRRVPFSYFARPDSFSAIPRASGPDFMFCAPRLVFGGTVGVGSLFHVFRFWTYFRRYRGRRGPVFMFCAPDSFSVVPWASSPVFMFCVPGLIFGSIEGVGSRFLVLPAQISIW
jgi:hypothetical protein